MVSIYAKTRKGQEEIEGRSGGLPPRIRRLLILIDGKRRLDELKTMVGDPSLEQTLAILEEEGYIEAIGKDNAAASAAPTPANGAQSAALAGLPAERDAQQVEMARNFMMNTLKTFNGPYAKLTLVQQIHDASNHVALRGLFEEWFAAIQETSAGRKRAEELRGRLFSVL